MEPTLFTLEEMYPGCKIKDHKNTIEFSFPITFQLHDAIRRNTSIDLFAESPMKFIISLGGYEIESRLKRATSYCPLNLFCNRYKFIITETQVFDHNTNLVETHNVKLVVKADKPRGFYIPDTLYSALISLYTNGMLYICKNYRKLEDGSKDTKFDHKQLLQVSGIITGSIKKKDK